MSVRKRNFYLPENLDRIMTACLGPTNTGKTTHALERMLSYDTGMIGFPLRLLARENYDRVVAQKGVSAVALVTGEEKIIPAQARYFLCTVEAMPVEREFDFLAIDEIQLCADPERGHVFTDRLLRARGTSETMFLGADTMRTIIKELVPETRFESRPRLSLLEWSGFKKLSRLPKRTAVVAFSIDDVYRTAELIRRHRGGTALVLGALSPRARNAQVELYQSGDVDFMVATDAIGMGLNMDIHHIALAATRKFDGLRPRRLTAAELAQIAGRAGRAKRDGTFGVTGPVQDLEPEIVEMIKHHVFPPLEQIIWRNHDLDFSSAKALLASLEVKSGHPMLVRGRTSDDHATLSGLMERPDICARATTPDTVRLLWETCQIPDFRKTLSDTHQALVAEIFLALLAGPLLPEWVRGRVSRLDDISGSVDVLMTRIAHIRTWTFITHRTGWVREADTLQRLTLQIEDRLSDALHDALTRRFVDRQTSVLLKAIEEKGSLLAGVRANGDVIVEGQKIGVLTGFHFIPDDRTGGNEYKSIMAAARQALKQELKRRMTDLLNAAPSQFRLQENGDICYQPLASNPLPGARIARMKKGETPYLPDVVLEDSALLQDVDKHAAAQKIKEALKAYISTILGPLIVLNAQMEEVPAQARGILHQLFEDFGILPRTRLEDLIADLDTDGRRILRARGVRLGPVLVFMPALGKPAAVKLKALLFNLWNERPLPAEVPRDGSVSQVVDPQHIHRRYYQTIGYPVYGKRAIRADMLDRLVCEIYDSAKDGKFQAQHKMAEWLGCPIAELYEILTDLGHKQVSDTPVAEPETDVVAAIPSEPVPQTADVPAEQPVTEIEAEAKAETEAATGASVEAEIETPPEASSQKKPDLATFLLKRGKAAQQSRPKPAQKPARPKSFKSDKGDRKPQQKMIVAAAKKSEDDSPFAILKQLKGEK
ncbi:MAG: helicase [Rhodospirillales bacterium]|nr:helicase [Rhodospirillales bacterium]